MTQRITIHKEFSFCFGHRVHNQVLEAEYSNNSPCKCRHLHGHEGKVVVHLTSDQLVRGMVTDFNNLAWLKTFLDNTLDHKFIIDRHDPLFGMLCMGTPERKVNLEGVGTVGHQLVTPDGVSQEMAEYLESFFIVDFVPTSENFSQWLLGLIALKMMPLGVTVSKVEWWESPKSCSVVEV